MDELIAFLKEKGSPQLCANLLVLAKANYGKLNKYKFTATNHKLRYNGDIEGREFAFKQEILKFQNKYPMHALERFYLFWSERTQDGDKMLWETYKTFEIGKRLGRGNYAEPYKRRG